MLDFGHGYHFELCVKMGHVTHACISGEWVGYKRHCKCGRPTYSAITAVNAMTKQFNGMVAMSVVRLRLAQVLCLY